MTADRPLLTVITPTWKRHDLLLETVANVKAQTYPNLEHLIVSDGPDPDLRHKLWAAGHRPADLFSDGGPTKLTFVELGRNWTEFQKDSFGIGAILAGMLQARGEYACWWCDDERAEATHLTKLVDIIERENVDFAYGLVQFYRVGQEPQEGFQIGVSTPMQGQFTHSVWRMSVLQKAMPQWGTHPVDIRLAEAWMAAGATWGTLPEVTFSHRADR